MLYKKQLDSEIRQLKSLETLVDVYGEIASSRMMKIRQFVLSNRNFLESINDIFKSTLSVYVKKTAQKGLGHITFLPHNGKTVAVFISANTGFYGDIVEKSFKDFISDVLNEDMEAAIVGKVGVSMYLSHAPKRPYTYFELSDWGIEKDNLEKLIRHLVQYKTIKVYHGKYKTVVTQDSVVTDISAGTDTSDVEYTNEDYIFEPSIEDILMFFETQVFTSLFDQVLRESQLARYASRILAMDSASANISNRIKEARIERLMAIHKEINKKQINSLSSSYYAFSVHERHSKGF